MFWTKWLKLKLGPQSTRHRVVIDLWEEERYPYKAISLLATALRDRDPKTRKDAANALEGQARRAHKGFAMLGGTIYEEASDRVDAVHDEFLKTGAIKALRAALKDEVWDVRRNAAVVLGWVGGREAVEELIELVEWDPDWHVREQSAGALGLMRDRRAVDPLVNALSSDRDFPVRLYCARALGNLGDPRAVPALGAALQDENKEVRREARDALWAIGGEEAEEVIRAAEEAERTDA